MANGDISDESYGEESIQEWGHEPLVPSASLLAAALNEVEMVSDPGSTGNSKEDSETARLLDGSSGVGAAGVGVASNVVGVVAGNGNGSNGSIAGLNGNVRKRI